ncbi:hypothetical protein BJ508DRAFT_112960 [Ascobolus immersus RN42]|uniref:Uncharacterized protein n=1 Tax=Ascobolus immersus RN42 TaxID=1160509 RepID=A0A3N4H855_ASCIM|nr:hypothetical protein BJ508DRAFT_112960 [Ascobolus immersus RN42]
MEVYVADLWPHLSLRRYSNHGETTLSPSRYECQVITRRCQSLEYAEITVEKLASGISCAQLGKFFDSFLNIPARAFGHPSLPQRYS